MAEQGETPGGRRGYAGTWPPHAAAQAGRYAPSDFRAWSSLIERLGGWARAEAGGSNAGLANLVAQPPQAIRGLEQPLGIWIHAGRA